MLHLDLVRGAEYIVSVRALTVNGTGPPTAFISAETFTNDLDGKSCSSSWCWKAKTTFQRPVKRTAIGTVSFWALKKTNSRKIYDFTPRGHASVFLIRLCEFNYHLFIQWKQYLYFILSSDLHVESVVPGEPTSLRVRSLTNSIVVSWTPPATADRIMIRGYILGYGIGVPDVYRQFLDAKQRYHTIKGLSE